MDNKLKKFYRILLNTLIVIFIINIMIYIFRGCRAWLNDDSTFLVNYSLEQISNNSFFPAEWYHCNDFWIYSLIPLVTMFIKFGFSLFLSRQFSVFIQTAIFFLLLIDFYKNTLNDKKGLMFVLLMLLSGVSGQFFFEMYGDATYATIIFYMLLELNLYLKYIKTNKKKYMVFFGIILCFVTACSLRFPIFIGAPIICCILYRCYDEKITKENIIAFLTTCGSVLIGYIIFKYMSSVLYISSNFSSFNLIHDDLELTTNIKSAVFDYLSAFGATGQGILSLNRVHYIDYIKTSSPLVVLPFIRYIFAFITTLIPFLLIKKIKSMTKLEKAIYIYVCSFVFIIVFFLLIGNMAWWPRYIIPIVFFLLLLYPLFYKYFFQKEKKKRIVFNILIIIFSLSAFFFSVTSYFDFTTKSFRVNFYDRLSEFLLSKDLTFGYGITANESVYKTLTEGKLEVIPLDASAKYILAWGVSKDWYRNDYHDGRVFLTRLKTVNSTEIEKKAIESYVFEDYLIFVFESNDVVVNNLY